MSKSALFALNIMDLLTHLDETHYIGHNHPAKVSYFSQLALASLQHQGKELQGIKQSIANCGARYKPLKKPPKTHIAKLTHLEKHLPESSKQFRHKQSHCGTFQHILNHEKYQAKYVNNAFSFCFLNFSLASLWCQL